MKYIVLEVQNDGTNVGTLVSSYDNRREADSAYHRALASAAISGLKTHTVFILTEYGIMANSECYRNDIEDAIAE